MSIIEILDPIQFNNSAHLINFLNYLYRTDKQQKWTNELTCDNYEYFSNGTKKKFDRDYKTRHNYKLDVHRNIAKKVGAQNVTLIKAKYFQSYIIYFDEEPKMSLLDYSQVLANMVYQNRKKNDDWIVDVVVSHFDQGQPHLHIVEHRIPRTQKRKER